MVMRMDGSHGVSLPSAVREALERKTPAGDQHGRWCVYLSLSFFAERYNKRLLKR
jgi:hypothetical protein